MAFSSLCLDIQSFLLKDLNGLLKNLHALIDFRLGDVQRRHEPDRVVGGCDDQQSTLTRQRHQGRRVDMELQSKNQALGANLLDQRRLQ